MIASWVIQEREVDPGHYGINTATLESDPTLGTIEILVVKKTTGPKKNRIVFQPSFFQGFVTCCSTSGVN